MKFKVHGREYDAPEFDSITFREASMIKKATGLRMGELPEAFAAGDTDALLSMFIVSKLRADGAIDLDAVGELKIDSLEVVPDEPEPEDPPKADAEPAEAPGKTQN